MADDDEVDDEDREEQLDASTIEDMLLDFLHEQSVEPACEAMADSSTNTFHEDGVLTRDRGLVIKLKNGAEFQVTIVQSRRARS